MALARREAKAVWCMVSCDGPNSATCTTPSASIAGRVIQPLEIVTSQPITASNATWIASRIAPGQSDRADSARNSVGVSTRSDRIATATSWGSRQ